MKYDKWPLEYRFKDLEPYIDRLTVVWFSKIRTIKYWNEYYSSKYFINGVNNGILC